MAKYHARPSAQYRYEHYDPRFNPTSRYEAACGRHLPHAVG